MKPNPITPFKARIEFRIVQNLDSFGLRNLKYTYSVATHFVADTTTSKLLICQGGRSLPNK